MYEADLVRARELIPLWVRWLEALTYPCLTFALVLLLADAGAWWLSRSLRANPQAHWTERARQLHRVRRWVSMSFFVVVIPTTWIVSVRPNRLAMLPTAAVFIACLIVGWAARGLVASSLRERWMPDDRSLTWRSRLGLFVFAYSSFSIVVGLSLFLPPEPGVAALAVALTLSAIGVALMLGGSCWVMGWLGLARRVDLAEFGIQGTMPFEFVWSIEVPMANAFAFPLIGQVGVTQRAFELLDAGELAAVLRHEAAHLAESKWLKVGRVAFAALFQAWAYVRVIGANYGVGASWAVPLTLLPAILLLRRRQHHEEIRADDAAIGAGSDASVYARALEKLHESSLAPAVMGRRMPHRDLHDRMVAAGVTPGWPKPEGVPRIPIYLSTPLVLIGLAILFGPQVIDNRMTQHLMTSAEGEFMLCVTGDERLYLYNFAGRAYAAGDFEQSITLEHAAACVEPREAAMLAGAALTLCVLDRCDEARADLAEAERRSALWPDPSVNEPWLQPAREGVASLVTRSAYASFEAGNEAESVTLYHSATQIDPRTASPLADASIVLSGMGRCDEARTDLIEAERRGALAPDETGLADRLERARQALSNCSPTANTAASQK
jgi:Zn-dependent protease with chaperone function